MGHAGRFDRYLVLAALVAAHLSVALHMADHGAGGHTHTGVYCLVGAAADDDDLASPPSLTDSAVRARQGRLLIALMVNGPSIAGVPKPPATGPPASAG